MGNGYFTCAFSGVPAQGQKWLASDPGKRALRGGSLKGVLDKKNLFLESPPTIDLSVHMPIPLLRCDPKISLLWWPHLYLAPVSVSVVFRPRHRFLDVHICMS